jgi:hypothetical protein
MPIQVILQENENQKTMIMKQTSQAMKHFILNNKTYNMSYPFYRLL